MTGSASTARQGDGRLWAIALVLSLLVNLGILGIAGFTMLNAQVLRRSQPVATAPAASETTVTIFPELTTAASSPAETAAPSPAEPAPAKPRFARTSEDQAADEPETRAFIGERNTRATSDRAPDPTAPPLPSQAGIDRDDVETTESRYQDGRLGSDQPAKPQESMPVPPSPTLPDPAMAAKAAAGEKAETPGTDETKSSPPPQETLLSGPNPMDVPVLRDPAEKGEIKPTPAKRPKEGETAAKAAEDAPKPAAAANSATDPGFKGYQRKAAIVGSISRTGRSALNVADSPLGRYQAAISRAVEQEWQRNCVRHRDFITPGFLTVRFFVETSGKVRTVQFVGAMQTGEVQKGFTLSSIRDAEIPPMPPAVKKEFTKEPLELIFNFYF